MAHKPGAVRSVDVCLDSDGPFIDMSDATRKAQDRRSGFPDQVSADSVGSMVAHEVIVAERLRAIFRVANRSPD